MTNFEMPMSKEQQEKNNEFIRQELDRVIKIAKENGLIVAICFHWDPLQLKLVATTAYFEERYEATIWQEHKQVVYDSLKLPCTTYVY